jgi:hypothetical protein
MSYYCENISKTSAQNDIFNNKPGKRRYLNNYGIRHDNVSLTSVAHIRTIHNGAAFADLEAVNGMSAFLPHRLRSSSPISVN